MRVIFLQELVMRLEDCRSKERRLEELKHNLEVCLADATQQIQELKVSDLLYIAGKALS